MRRNAGGFFAGSYPNAALVVVTPFVLAVHRGLFEFTRPPVGVESI